MRRSLALGLVGILALFAALGGGRIVVIAFFVAIGVALVLGVPALVRSIGRSRSSRVCWLVALAVAALITGPQMALSHYKHVAGAVVGGILWWLLLAGLLRLVIFLADYFRRRPDRAPVGS